MKKWTPVLLLILLCLALQPVTARALTPLEPDRECSLTLSYSQDGFGFDNLQIRLYRVAEAHADGSFQLIAPFSGYPVGIHGITAQKEWQEVASTLKAYIAADQLPPTRTETTDQTGTVTFSGLETGLYLVMGAIAENQLGTYRFNDFMVYLPTPLSPEEFDYDVQAKPKCTKFTPHPTYSVTKLWKDAGNEEKRPHAVTVDIFKDGQLHQTVVLNAENNWRYSWNATDGQGLWTVVERDVPENYQVTVSENETAFLITNTSTDPSKPPQTGDVFPLWPLALGLCLSGFGLVLVGAWHERKRT